MKKILIFAGTTEGRNFAGKLAKSGRDSVVCVATEYGELVMQDEDHERIRVHRGRMEQQEMEDFMRGDAFEAVVDATHPYAVLVSENIRAAAEHTRLSYYRLNREAGISAGRAQSVRYFSDIEQCAAHLEHGRGNILLTTGSKELKKFMAHITNPKRVFARVLPGTESLMLCGEAGLAGKQIIAMQGPFSKELNLALIHEFEIAHLVTKESGKIGGQEEKLAAACEAGIEACVIAKPEQRQGYGTEELLSYFAADVKKEEKRKIALIGIGMGNLDMLTREAERALQEADIFFGAERMLAMAAQYEKSGQPFYFARDVLGYLAEHREYRRAAVLFSGDIGFYSGAEKFRRELLAQREFVVESYSGISSLACFAARLGVSYQDAAQSSMHGRKINVVETVRRNEKSFFLLSGREDLQQLKSQLTNLLSREEAEALEIAYGCWLSYPEEVIWRGTLDEFCAPKQEGPCIVYVKNPFSRRNSLTHGLPDQAFLRGEVPMTKEEVREICISKLRLSRGAVFYDIGSGTGSISIEAARVSETIEVHAFEQREEAVELLQKNCEKFGISNITVHHVKAPAGMEGIAPPTHAFIGGSGGNLRDIMAKLVELNPTIRIVVSAITIETLSELRAAAGEFSIAEEEILQIQVSRAKQMGNYHLMRAENPIFLASFSFGREVK